MILTNKLSLPTPLVRAVSRDPYNSGDSDISVTRLIQPPRKVALEHLHKDEMTEDVSDRLYALLGQISHLILERAADGSMVEKRLKTEVLGWKVSGQLDYMPSENQIIDYKLTSIWAFKDGLKPEHEQQINLLAFLASRNGIRIEKGQIIGIFRDWSLTKSKYEANYPPAQVQVLDVPIWSEDQQYGFLADRVEAHQKARHKLPECTQADTWSGRRCKHWCGAFQFCEQANPKAANPESEVIK